MGKNDRSVGQVRVSVSISRSIWDEAGAVLKTAGFSRSGFIALMLGEIVRHKDVGVGRLVRAYGQTFEKVLLSGLENMVKGEKKLRP